MNIYGYANKLILLDKYWVRMDVNQELKFFVKIEKKLELMFMKHYAPNRCLYIKVAKLRTGVGSAEMSHLQNCSLKIYLKRALGVGLGGSGWM